MDLRRTLARPRSEANCSSLRAQAAGSPPSISPPGLGVQRSAQPYARKLLELRPALSLPLPFPAPAPSPFPSPSLSARPSPALPRHPSPAIPPSLLPSLPHPSLSPVCLPRSLPHQGAPKAPGLITWATKRPFSTAASRPTKGPQRPLGLLGPRNGRFRQLPSQSKAVLWRIPLPDYPFE